MPIRIVIPAESVFDDATGEFTDREERVLYLEHSLLSMSRWESEYKEPFVTAQLTPDAFRYYIRCMCEDYLTDEEVEKINLQYKSAIVEYMFDERCAKENRPSRKPNPGGASSNRKRQFLPTEEFYYIMFERGVPLSCEKWHFSRLVALLRTYEKHDSKSKSKNKKKPSLTNDQWSRLSQINRSRLNNG